jgi:hypothetical protein|tara:strand:- start:16 stop:1143 length:1128 start_codon:yes stop_codon:yes gene_type:complete
MVKRIFVVSPHKSQTTLALPGKDYLSYTFEEEIKNCIKVHPDEIWINIVSEMEVHTIFRNFLEGMRQWCVTHSRKIIIHMPSGWEPRILNDPITDVRDTYGYHLIMHIHNKTLPPHVPQTDFTNLFTCYNNRQDRHRTALVKRLHQTNLLDDGIVTYNILNDDGYDDPYIEILKGLDLTDPLEKEFELHKTPAMAPCVFPPSFNTSLIDLVTESRYETEDDFFFTEKTNKPLVCMKPFLVMSNKGFHKKLKDRFGIEPYTEIFDYAFDNEPDYKVRAEGIVQNMLRLKDRFPTPESRKEVSLYLHDKLSANRETHLNYVLNKELMTPEAYKIFDREGDCTLHGDWESSLGSWLSHAEQQGWIPVYERDRFIHNDQ